MTDRSARGCVARTVWSSGSRTGLATAPLAPNRASRARTRRDEDDPAEDDAAVDEPAADDPAAGGVLTGTAEGGAAVPAGLATTSSLIDRAYAIEVCRRGALQSPRTATVVCTSRPARRSRPCRNSSS